LYIQKSKQLHNTIQLAIDNLRTTTWWIQKLICQM
jgi:hypothetical protein